MYGKSFSYWEISAKYQEALNSIPRFEEVKAGDVPFAKIVLHPYLGFTLPGPQARFASGFELRAERDPLEASHDQHVAIVAIAGGSVAYWNLYACRETLKRYIEKLPQFKGRDIMFTMLGAPAYNQPQQLISVMYYLARGGRIDMLINLDGFNEARNAFDNQKNGISPDFPYYTYWASIFSGELKTNSNVSVLMADIMMWKHLRYNLASVAYPTRFSVTLSTLWSFAGCVFQEALWRAGGEPGVRQWIVVARLFPRIGKAAQCASGRTGGLYRF